jgi:hypothetical protein
LNVANDPGPWPWNVTELKTGTDFVYALNVSVEAPASIFDTPKSTVVNTSYTVWNESQYKVMAVFDDFFPAFYTAEDLIAEPVLRFKNYLDGPSTRNLIYNPWLAPNNITRHMERLATSMTNILRSNMYSNEMIPGQAFNQEKFVSITWAWLIFPLILLVLSLVFLVSTIIKTSKDPATGMWKTSAMPTLIYGLPKETQSKLNPASSWNSTHESSKKVRIKLLPNMGWRVSGISHVSTSPQLPRPAVQAPRGWI